MREFPRAAAQEDAELLLLVVPGEDMDPAEPPDMTGIDMDMETAAELPPEVTEDSPL